MIHDHHRHRHRHHPHPPHRRHQRRRHHDHHHDAAPTPNFIQREIVLSSENAATVLFPTPRCERSGPFRAAHSLCGVFGPPKFRGNKLRAAMSVCPAKNIPAASGSTGKAPAELTESFVAYFDVEIGL